LGTVDSGQEAQFMSVVPTLRKMLAAKNPAKWKVPIWFTEIGTALGGQVTTASQAQDLVKAYTMSIAQGASHIEWFEAQDGGYAMGLLNSSGIVTPSYVALSNLVSKLGPNPAYQGWVLLNNQDYGFVFQGATSSVMAAWVPPNSVDTLNFGQPVRILNPVNGSNVNAATYALSNAPVLVVGVPSNLVSQAQSNCHRPFPWGGDFSGASSVSVVIGSPNTESGLHQLNADASSTAVTAYGGPARDCSKSSAQTFTVDPNFLSYTHASIKISAVVRRISSTDNPGFNLKYESATGRKGIGWNSVAGSDRWYTLTWPIADDELVGNWGYDFSLDSDSTNYSRYYLQKVTVTNVVPRLASSPTGLMAAPGVGLISLNWNSVSGATAYNVKRSTISHGPYEVIAPPLFAPNYTDANPVLGTPCYYVVSAANTGGEGPDSAEAGATAMLPSLRALLSGESCRLSWPTSATGFALQETTVLPGAWTNSSSTAQVQGSDYVAVVSVLGRTKFYRLGQ
ncbi:MAG: hypothetical protein NTW03_05340, partial [Verrucomicrobia bacterium]|nr:hypothetical protein [Verrucomicrobiota bacterium]